MWGVAPVFPMQERGVELKNISDLMKQINNTPDDVYSLCAKLEVFVGNYFVSCEGVPGETIFTIYFDPAIDREECVQESPEKVVAYVTSDYKYAFVLEHIFDKFVKDTFEYGLHYIPVSDFSQKEFFIELTEEIPDLFRKITWINDDFLDDEHLEFDFEAFYKIDDGIRYINPNHFSINELIFFLQSPKTE